MKKRYLVFRITTETAWVEAASEDEALEQALNVPAEDWEIDGQGCVEGVEYGLTGREDKT